MAEGLTDPEMGETLYEVCGGILMNEQPDWASLKAPKQILWNDEKGERLITIPTNLRAETLAQKVMMNQILKGDAMVMEAIPKAVSIYLHTIIRDCKPDQKIMEEVAEEIKKRNALEVYSLSNFFFMKQRHLQISMLRSLLLKSKTLSKDRRRQQTSKV